MLCKPVKLEKQQNESMTDVDELLLKFIKECSFKSASVAHSLLWSSFSSHIRRANVKINNILEMTGSLSP